jgi:hypothetical protein
MKLKCQVIGKNVSGPLAYEKLPKHLSEAAFVTTLTHVTGNR